MQLVDAFTSGWSRCGDYNGRSNRGDYWWFVLANLIVSVVIGLISSKIQGLYSLISLIPGIPLAVRRLRDAGKPWQWLFIALIPIIGSIWLIVLLCQPSISG